MIVRGRLLERGFRRSARVVVVGTGAGGAMCARQLARAGHEVVALEMGGFHTPRDFNQREEEMLAMLFQEQAGRTSTDLAITVLQGRGVGGSTVHNTNLCKRIPDEILDRWQHEHELTGWSPEEMAPLFEATERDLSVSRISPERLNPQNRLLKRGAEALGWRGGMLSHNRVGCVGSGFCEMGCAYNAKQNALKVLIPDGVEHGLDVYSDCRVERVLTRRGRAIGVRGHVVDGRGGIIGPFEVRADAVVLAGSAVGSAALLIASGVPDPFDRLGRGLHLHPGAPAAGLYDEELRGWAGVPQSYEVMEHLDFSGEERRAWIVANFAHPIGTATNLPGFGAAHARLMARYPQLAVFTPMLHDLSEGRVRVGWRGRIRIDYSLDARDREQMARGLAAAARLHLAAGARRVVIPFGEPLEIRDEGDLDGITAERIVPLGLPVVAVHPMGAVRMSGSARRGVTRPDGRHHQVRGLWVADGGLFPSSIGVPPQIPIYTAGRLVARHVDAALPGESASLA